MIECGAHMPRPRLMLRVVGERIRNDTEVCMGYILDKTSFIMNLEATSRLKEVFT